MTDNHNYNEPAQGSLDWDVPLNTNFRSLDTDVEIRDTDANKSNYTPKSGAKFFATDTLKIYLGDGSAWTEEVDLSSIGMGGAKTYHRSAADWGTNSGNEQVIHVIPGSLIDEVTAVYATLYDANDNVDAGATNGAFKIKLYDGLANVGSTQEADRVWWNAGERFTDSPPYQTISSGNDGVLTIQNDTGAEQTVSFGFEYL